ncbi:hypothetical protein IJ380_03675 [Candidatus Saccharibacteria bacterium]|nr:hypothetical protein [Candidatus Saccharibacteria bacterium]
MVSTRSKKSYVPFLTEFTPWIYPTSTSVAVLEFEERSLSDLIDRIEAGALGKVFVPEDLVISAMVHDDNWFEPGEIHLKEIYGISLFEVEPGRPYLKIETDSMTYYADPPQLRKVPQKTMEERYQKAKAERVKKIFVSPFPFLEPTPV